MYEYEVFHDVAWHGTYALYFFTIGIAAALFFFSAKSWFTPAFVPVRASAAYAAFVLLVVSGLLLIGDLSQPARFLNILNPLYLNFDSPLAWGGLNLVSFGLVCVAYLYVMRSGNESMAKKLGVLGSLLALGLPVYTGFDLTVHQNRPVWNTPLMPVLFVALSLASGAAVASFLAIKNEETTRRLRLYLLWSGGAVAVMLVSLLGTTAYGGSQQELTFMLMTTGSLGMIFIGLGIVLGTAAPIVLLLAPFGRQQMGLMAASLLILVGGLALRYSILMGPQIVQTFFS